MSLHRQTHTVATLEISAAAHAEIAQLLREAGYDHVFDRGVIDMTGIGLAAGQANHAVRPSNVPLAWMGKETYLGSPHRELVKYESAAMAMANETGGEVIALYEHPGPALPAMTPSDTMTTITITTPGLAMLGGCDCYGKAPTVPVYRDRMNHLNDCPAKGSGYPVGTMRAHVPATPSDDGASLIAAERHRQPDDDETLVGGELVDSAILLIDQARGGNIEWTGEPLACARKLAARHTGDQVRLLTIAGAFLAAEIDRLRRVSPSEGSAPDTPTQESR